MHKRTPSQDLSQDYEAIAQESDVTVDFLTERILVVFPKEKIRCGIKDQARIHVPRAQEVRIPSVVITPRLQSPIAVRPPQTQFDRATADLAVLDEHLPERPGQIQRDLEGLAAIGTAQRLKNQRLHADIVPYFQATDPKIMQAQHWLDHWEEGRIGFHQPQVNTHLTRFWPVVAPAGPVFAPLCGKSLDMLWLRAQGHPVLGVELAPQAIEAFFTENRLEPEITQQGPFQRWACDDLVLLQGDFFDLRPEDLADMTEVDPIFRTEIGVK